MKEPLRNIGILAHVDAGKTTITEQLLYLSGEIRAPGSVDEGTAHTDRLDVERARGISVQAAATSFVHGGVRINLIDTPGHMDFVAEVERALRVLDGAVLVVSAAEGIQAQTEVLWQALRAQKIPTLVFINKLDRMGADEQAVVEGLKDKFSSRMLPLQKVERAGNGFAVEPLWPAGSDGPGPDRIVEALSDFDDSLLEDYVAGRAVSCPRMEEALAGAVKDCAVFPVLFGAAIRGVGVSELASAVTRYLPPPVVTGGGAVAGVVFKIEHDKTMGKAAYVRLYGGTLRNRDAVALPSGAAPAKISQIRRMLASRSSDIGELQAGDIAAVYGLGDVKMGDILGDGALVPAGLPLAVPLLRVQAFPALPTEYARLTAALAELAEEDPALDLMWLRDERELHISVMGRIQLEVLESVLLSRFGLAVTFGAPSVIYKETPAKAGRGYVAYTMPKPCWAILDFEIEPLPRGAGLVYSSVVRDDKIFYRYQEHVRKTVPEALKQGLYGWEVTDLKVTLVGGEHHTIHTHPMDFFTATPMGIMDGLQNCGMTLLEPLLTLRISAPEEFAGRFIRDVLDMRGSFDSPVITNGNVTVEALVPVSTSLDYSVRLGALTSGRGMLTARFSGYRPCPVELGATMPYRGVNPLDRANYILKIRGATK